MRKTLIALIAIIAPLAHGQAAVSTARIAESPPIHGCPSDNNPRLTVHPQCNGDKYDGGHEPCVVSNSPRLPLELWAQQVQCERRYARVSESSNLR